MIELSKLASKILEDHKCENIEVIDVSSRTPFSQEYVLATCPNIRALGANVEILEDELAKFGYTIRASHGAPESGWIVVDVDEILVHLFLEEERAKIDLETLLTC